MKIAKHDISVKYPAIKCRSARILPDFVVKTIPSPGRTLDQSYPSLFLMAEMKKFGVERLSQNLQRFDQARSRAIEILIAVCDEDAIVFHRFQLPPRGFSGQQMRLFHRARDVEAARRDEDHVGIRRDLVHSPPQTRDEFVAAS